MHTVEMLSEAIALARKLGYQIREDQLEGAGGGHCLIRGRKWLLLDVTQSADEQLRDVLDAVREGGSSPNWLQEALREGESVDISPELAEEIVGSSDRRRAESGEHRAKSSRAKSSRAKSSREWAA